MMMHGPANVKKDMTIFTVLEEWKIMTKKKKKKKKKSRKSQGSATERLKLFDFIFHLFQFAV
jgi:hypothetical protein